MLETHGKIVDAVDLNRYIQVLGRGGPESLIEKQTRNIRREYGCDVRIIDVREDLLRDAYIVRVEYTQPRHRQEARGL